MVGDTEVADPRAQTHGGGKRSGVFSPEQHRRQEATKQQQSSSSKIGLAFLSLGYLSRVTSKDERQDW